MVMAGLAELSAMNGLMSRLPPGEAAYRTLLKLDPSTPEPNPELLSKAKAHAVMYYARGPATTECPYLRERAWLSGYADACGMEVRFPHVERVAGP